MTSVFYAQGTFAASFHAIDATRIHERRRWVVSLSILSEFGRDRDSCHTGLL